MKIVILSHSDSTGGAAIAAYRLFKTLQATGHDVKMLVQQKTLKGEDDIIKVGTTLGFYFRFLVDRLSFMRREATRKVRFRVSLGAAGVDVSRNRYVRQADLVHMHWINNGFISLRGLDKLMSTGKRIVWTMHDKWAFSGGCHYCNDVQCRNFETHCGKCPFVKGFKKNDITSRVFDKKAAAYAKASSLRFISCSNWLACDALRSSLVGKYPVTVIPNPIDTSFFAPQDGAAIKERLGLDPAQKYILFGAANLNDKHKGISHLIKAMKIVASRNKPGSLPSVLLFGRMDEDVTGKFPTEVKYMGYISDRSRLVDLYAACDFFVLPSLDDNLPNTIMESLCCGRPALAFDTGGIPDMVKHKYNGFLAEYSNDEHLAEGIEWLMDNTDEAMRNICREFALENYSPESVVARIDAVYEGTVE